MESINIIAIILSPIIAVLITLWYQDRKEKRDWMVKIFQVLMAHRKVVPPSYNLTDALNTIDIGFAKYPKVVELWHQYFELLCREDNPNIDQLRSLKFRDLLFEMGQTLGYKNLSATDIDNFYTPRSHNYQSDIQIQVQEQLLRVLKNSDALVLVKKEPPVFFEKNK